MYGIFNGWVVQSIGTKWSIKTSKSICFVLRTISTNTHSAPLRLGHSTSRDEVSLWQYCTHSSWLSALFSSTEWVWKSQFCECRNKIYNKMWTFCLTNIYFIYLTAEVIVHYRQMMCKVERVRRGTNLRWVGNIPVAGPGLKWMSSDLKSKAGIDSSMLKQVRAEWETNMLLTCLLGNAEAIGKRVWLMVWTAWVLT